MKTMPIDRCIAPIIKALLDAGIETEESCCGHENSLGYIALADDRCFVIVDGKEAWNDLRAILDAGKGECYDPSRCSNCGMDVDEAPHRITGGIADEDEWFCSSYCYDEHAELGCPFEVGDRYRSGLRAILDAGKVQP